MGSTRQPSPPSSAPDLAGLAGTIRRWALELGFDDVGIADTSLGAHEGHLRTWLAGGNHGEMGYMARNERLRSRPAELHPGTIRVISARMNYMPPAGVPAWEALSDPATGYVARYALGRDYHKLMRPRLRRLARTIERTLGPFGHRVFTDSAPVLEKALAEKAGLGWIGKHTNLIAKDAGSWFLLGEIFTDLPLPVDPPAVNHCGSCRACLDICPTQAIVAPYRLDARRCISYLTIELRGAIPVELRPLLGNRVFGCDDCQLVCPWNRHARHSTEGDFTPRHGLDAPALVDLFAWREDEFMKYTEGSAIRRTGYEGWLRNIAVALGNALRDAHEPQRTTIIGVLSARLDDPSALVREHVRWALEQQRGPGGT